MIALEHLTVAAICGAVLTWLLSKYATVLGMIDHPGGHKHHAQPIPMVGGPAIAMAIAIALLVLARMPTPAQWTMLAAATGMLLIGLGDDRFQLAPSTRFMAQGVVALALALAGDALLVDLGALIDGEKILALGWFALPMTVFSIVGVINACNMSDGMDGAAGGMVVLAFAGALLLAFDHSAWVHAPIVASALGALLGFLLWNAPLWRSARAYLGDAGSLLVGTLLAWVVVAFSQGADRAFAPAAGLWLYAVPLIDTVSVMWRRVSDGRSPFQPDQRHLHHMLLRAGISTRNAWLILMLLAFAGVSIAVAATRADWPDPLLAMMFLAVAFSHHFLMRHADRHHRWLGRRLATDVASAMSSSMASEPSR